MFLYIYIDINIIAIFGYVTVICKVNILKILTFSRVIIFWFFYFRLLKLSHIFYKYKKSLHQLETLLIIKIGSSIVFIDKYFYLELRLCPWSLINGLLHSSQNKIIIQFYINITDNAFSSWNDETLPQ